MKNVLILNFEYPPLGGGGATVTRDSIRAMLQLDKNIKITLVTMWHKGLPFYEEHDRFEIYRLRSLRTSKPNASILSLLIFVLRSYKAMFNCFMISNGSYAYTPLNVVSKLLSLVQRGLPPLSLILWTP